MDDESPARGVETDVVETDAAETDAATVEARARALSSPLRMRILRLCLHEARTNKELAQQLGVNPGTLLHHVRTLVRTGFLAAEEPRSGNRGAREVPYRATRRSWHTPVPAIGPVLIETFLQEIRHVPPEDLDVGRLGLKLNAAGRAEVMERFRALLQELSERAPDPDGIPISILVVEHPEKNEP